MPAATTNVVQCYPAIVELPRSDLFELTVNDVPVPVYASQRPHFAAFGLSGPAALCITVPQTPQNVEIRPKVFGITPRIAGNRILLHVDGPVRVRLEIDELPGLYLVANNHSDSIEDGLQGDVIRLTPGQTYRDPITLTDNQTLYIPAGTFLQAGVRAERASNISVFGNGIIGNPPGDTRGRWSPLHFQSCTHVRVDGPMIVDSNAWCVVPVLSQEVHLSGLVILGERVTADGIDVVASKNVLIEDCLIHTKDDCIAVKSLKRRPEAADNVENVTVRNCTFYGVGAGNNMEIGYETCADSMRRIHFLNCDSIGAHGFCSVFSIHNGDRAQIEDVLYDTIRIEHMFNMLVDFRILHSRYSHDTRRGTIKNVHLRNIECVENIYNTHSIIGGHNAEHAIRDVTFENFRIGNQRVTCQDDMDLYLRHAHNVQFTD